jgi:DNA-binding response OmpR family regulator
MRADYLTKPFAYEELVARIRALLRRRPPRREQLDLGELTIDRDARRVLAHGGATAAPKLKNRRAGG